MKLVNTTSRRSSMKTYRVKLTYLYSKTVDVQAPDKVTAVQLAEQDEDEIEGYESYYVMKL